MNINKIIGIILTTVLLTAGVFMIVSDQQRAKESVSTPKVEIPTSVTSTSASVAPKSTTPSTTVSTPKTTISSGYTAVQVALHASAADCWTIVNGNVYNLTSWISRHPGGERAILQMCGTDASSDFNEQHGGQGGPERILAGYKVGALK